MTWFRAATRDRHRRQTSARTRTAPSIAGWRQCLPRASAPRAARQRAPELRVASSTDDFAHTRTPLQRRLPRRSQADLEAPRRRPSPRNGGGRCGRTWQPTGLCRRSESLSEARKVLLVGREVASSRPSSRNQRLNPMPDARAVERIEGFTNDRRHGGLSSAREPRNAGSGGLRQSNRDQNGGLCMTHRPNCMTFHVTRASATRSSSRRSRTARCRWRLPASRTRRRTRGRCRLDARCRSDRESADPTSRRSSACARCRR